MNIRNRFRWVPGSRVTITPRSKDLVINMSPHINPRGDSTPAELVIPAQHIGQFLRESQEAIRQLAALVHKEAEEKAAKDQEGAS